MLKISKALKQKLHVYNSITQELAEHERVPVPATLVDTKECVSVKHPVQYAPSQKNIKGCACVYKRKWLFYIYKCNHNYILVIYDFIKVSFYEVEKVLRIWSYT